MLKRFPVNLGKESADHNALKLMSVRRGVKKLRMGSLTASNVRKFTPVSKTQSSVQNKKKKIIKV